MAETLPLFPPEDIAGPFLSHYGLYWKKLDFHNSGKVSSIDAARFLKRSGLSNENLRAIWEISDSKGIGYMDKQSMFTAFKLVALCQAGRDISIGKILDKAPLPKFRSPQSMGASGGKVQNTHAVKPEEKLKYQSLFNQLKGENEKVSGDRVRKVMLCSKLPIAVLGRIWDLADQDKDGFLDEQDFITAMHLVNRARKGDPVPTNLPPQLVNKVDSPTMHPQYSAEDIAGPFFGHYNLFWKKLDFDDTGKVRSEEAASFLKQSGLSKEALNTIWTLSDTKGLGYLDQQCLFTAFKLVAVCQNGKDISLHNLLDKTPLPKFQPPQDISKRFQTGLGSLSSMMRTPINVAEDSCIICVGSTGAGKSSTVALFTGNKVPVSDSTSSVTTECKLYENLLDEDGAPWLDTVGWEDLDKDDSEIFKEILSHIQEQKKARLQAVIWCVTPQVRTDASVSKQANFINKLKHGDVWNNVIIVVKQSINPDYDASGALMAAANFNLYANIQVVGYRFIHDLSLNASQRDLIMEDANVRRVMNFLNDDDIRAIINNKIKNLGDPVQIIFSNSICEDCGTEGDVRLMGPYCHMEPTRIHTGQQKLGHEQGTEQYHPTNRILKIHPGEVELLGYKFCCGYFQTPRYICCNGGESSEGCLDVLVCCKNSYGSPGCKTRYSCCGKPATSSTVEGLGCSYRFSCCEGDSSHPGCETICKKCQAPWGSKTDSCYKREHNVKSTDGSNGFH